MNRAITISRQYGSGGRELGEKLAMKLGIPFYDKELIATLNHLYWRQMMRWSRIWTIIPPALLSRNTRSP